MHRHVIDPVIQILSKYDKKSKNDISIEEEFRKSYIQVSTSPEVSLDYELSTFDVVTILNYFLSIQKRSLFADMKNANLNEKEMFETSFYNVGGLKLLPISDCLYFLKAEILCFISFEIHKEHAL